MGPTNPHNLLFPNRRLTLLLPLLFFFSSEQQCVPSIFVVVFRVALLNVCILTAHSCGPLETFAPRNYIMFNR